MVGRLREEALTRRATLVAPSLIAAWTQKS